MHHLGGTTLTASIVRVTINKAIEYYRKALEMYMQQSTQIDGEEIVVCKSNTTIDHYSLLQLIVEEL